MRQARLKKIKAPKQPNLNQMFKLANGRTLSYDEYGQPDGLPLFYFHGQPGSKSDWGFVMTEELTTRYGLRVISINRPGIGKSTFQAERVIYDWPDDVAALADHLKIPRFGILGLSAGGAYVAACLAKIPDRLLAAGIVSGIAPHHIAGLTDDVFAGSLKFFELCRRKPHLATFISAIMGLVLKLAPGSFIKQMKAGLSEADCEVLDRPEVLQNLVKSLKEGFSNPKGVHLDTCLMVSPWGFSPEQAKLPFPVRLWYGESDHLAPVAMGRYLAGAIANSQLKIFPGEGHMSLIVNNIGEILQGLSDDTGAIMKRNQPPATTATSPLA